MKVSIVLVTADPPELVRRALTSLFSEKFEYHEFVLVTPREDVVRVVRQFQPKNLRIVKDPGKGKPTAINMALRVIQGDVLLFVDGDVKIVPGSVQKLLRHFKKREVGLVTSRGVYEIPESSIFFEWAKISEETCDLIRRRLNKKGAVSFVNGPLYAVRGEILEPIPENILVDDSYIGELTVLKGFKAVYEPEAIVIQAFPRTIRDFVVQKARVRAGFAQLRKIFGRKKRSIRSDLVFGVKWAFRKYGVIGVLKRLHKFLFVGTLYFLSWILGYWLYFSKASLQKVWKPAETTKKVND